MTKNVLMLHGLAQSGDYFASKTKGFRTEMERLGYKLHYPTAPNEFPPADVPDFLGEVIADAPNDGDNTGVLAWLEDDPATDGYFIPQTTIDYLHSYVLENGPFSGIVGFSQGAGVAGYLATDFNGLLGLAEEEQPPLEFLMAFSGFRFQPQQYQEQYDLHPISVPSLHVQGELDTITEPIKVQGLYNSCKKDSSTLMVHSGGHFIPNSRGFLRKMSQWLQQLT